VRHDLGRLTGAFWDRPSTKPERPGDPWVERGPGGATVAVGSVLEIALPLKELGLTDGRPVAFFLAVYDDSGAEVERHPEHRLIEVVTPDELFEARAWRA